MSAPRQPGINTSADLIFYGATDSNQLSVGVILGRYNDSERP
jgi:hypothetical protein